jgi:hypothetical protein
MISMTDPYGRILYFLDWKHDFSETGFVSFYWVPSKNLTPVTGD